MSEQQPRIVVAGDSPNRLDEIVAVLRQELAAFTLSQQAMRDLAASLPDASIAAVLIRADPADPESLTSIAELVERAESSALILLTDTNEAQAALDAIRLGVQDCLVWPPADPRRSARAVRFAIERNQRLIALERDRRGLRQFAHLLAHEVRSPLTIVTTSLDVLIRLRGKELDEDSRECIEQSRAAAREIADSISQILAFADAGSQPDLDAVDCNAIMPDVVTSLARSSRERAERISHDGLPRVLSNRGVLQRAIRNFVWSILAAGEDSRAHLSGLESPDGWVISIAHRGRATPPDDLDAALNPGTQPRPAAARSRVSLGLVFAREAIERLGGRVSLETLGAGEWGVNVRLPRVTAAPGR